MSEVWDAVGRLPLERQILLKKAYGENLTDASGRNYLSDSDRKSVDEMLKGPLKRRLKNTNLSSQKRIKKQTKR